MKSTSYLFLAIIFIFSGIVTAQEETETNKREPGHNNTNRFKQLYEEFSTPNMFRTASGAPGPNYYQQQADYVMDVELDDKNKKINRERNNYLYTTILPTNWNTYGYNWTKTKELKNSKSPLIESIRCTT